MKTLISVLLVVFATLCPAQTVITNFRQVTAAAPSGGAPSFAQACDANTWSDSGTGASCVLASVPTGDVLLIVSIGPGVTVTVNGVELTDPLDSAKSDTVKSWIYPNTAAGNTPIVVSQTSTGTTHLFVAEFTGVNSDPLDAHVVGVCDSGCVYLGSIATPSFTVAANDLVWTWCRADFGGTPANLATVPEPSTEITTSHGIEYAEGYRVVSEAGSTYSQCDQLATGAVVSVALKGR